MTMTAEALRSLPGAEIVLAGLADLERGRETQHADAVLMASERLRAAGLVVPPSPRLVPPRTASTSASPRPTPAAPTPATTRSWVASSASPGPPSVRAPADEDRIRRLASALGSRAPAGTRLYLTGGATAVLEGWRRSTVDVDVRIEPESDELMRAISELKETLDVNVEFASPADFLPELPGWRERSRFRFRAGSIDVYDCDLYSQALSKIERSFDLDLADAKAMIEAELVEPERLRELFEAIEPELYRFPAVDPAGLRARLERAVG